MSVSKKSIALCAAIIMIFSLTCCKDKSVSVTSESKVTETAEISEKTTDSTIETAKIINFFKQGKWISSKGIYYFFNGANGYFENRNVPDTSTKFSYELNDDGTAVFHMEKNTSSLNASVNFKKPGIIDITWENGEMETLNFDTEEIPENILSAE